MPRRVSEYSIEELAGRQMALRNISPGVAFARATPEPNKVFARNQVLKLLGVREHPKGLCILTMPGLTWQFERDLLRLREGMWERKRDGKGSVHNTYICGIESDRSIWHAGVTLMPGGPRDSVESTTTILAPTQWAEKVVRNRFISRYMLGSVEALMAETDFMYDAAWIDFNGQLSLKRMDLLDKFFKHHIRRTLIVTSLKGRWDRVTKTVIHEAGGIVEWARERLGGVVRHSFDYGSGDATMTQFALSKL